MSELTVPIKMLEVSQYAKSVVTITCAECGTAFESKSPRHKCCSGACRQKAYRRSPAYRARLDQQKAARFERRLYRYQRRNRARALGFDGRYGGPLNR